MPRYELRSLVLARRLLHLVDDENFERSFTGVQGESNLLERAGQRIGGTSIEKRQSLRRQYHSCPDSRSNQHHVSVVRRQVQLQIVTAFDIRHIDDGTIQESRERSAKVGIET